MMILKATPEDAGVYTCRASNSQESLDSSSTIQVKGMFRKTMLPRKFVALWKFRVMLENKASPSAGIELVHSRSFKQRLTDVQCPLYPVKFVLVPYSKLKCT